MAKPMSRDEKLFAAQEDHDVAFYVNSDIRKHVLEERAANLLRLMHNDAEKTGNIKGVDEAENTYQKVILNLAAIETYQLEQEDARQQEIKRKHSDLQ